MLIIPPTKFRNRRGRIKPRKTQAAPLQELILVSASYSKDAYTLTLTFDRAVALVGFDGTQITVNDDTQLSLSFDALGGATITSPDTVVLALNEVGSPTGPGQTFNATAETGIVAADDGGIWGGAVNQGLPFP